MKIVINIEKKYFIFLVVLIGLVGGLSFAYNPGSGISPELFGHSFNEMGPGTAELTEDMFGTYKIHRPSDLNPDGTDLFVVNDAGFVSNPDVFSYSFKVNGRSLFEGGNVIINENLTVNGNINGNIATSVNGGYGEVCNNVGDLGKLRYYENMSGPVFEICTRHLLVVNWHYHWQKIVLGEYV